MNSIYCTPLRTTCFYTSFFSTDSLQSYKTVLLKRQSAQEELQEQVNHQKTPEMQAKLRECQEAEEQLDDIEKRLGESQKTY